MSKILVIGGFGFYGSKVAEALQARGHEVLRASRRPRPDATVFDLASPDSYVAIGEVDLVVNCSDSVNAPPDA
ncbi:MAG: NAD-dependent epimerase/dehydratase family protein, partial [Myxococcales bacterium]|nr:NAD-dependent epimerase/dehydratase family protein [Myxococcales bacterium]